MSVKRYFLASCRDRPTRSSEPPYESHFQDACTELFDIAGASRANWAATPPRRQALSPSPRRRRRTVAQLAPPTSNSPSPSRLRTPSPLPPYTASPETRLCPSYFELGWRRAYPGLSGLMGASCNSAEALTQAHGSPPRRPSPPPSELGPFCLSARVLLLIPHLDTAVLRTAPASDRVTKMEGLLKGSGGSACTQPQLIASLPRSCLLVAAPGSAPSDPSHARARGEESVRLSSVRLKDTLSRPHKQQKAMPMRDLPVVGASVRSPLRTLDEPLRFVRRCFGRRGQMKTVRERVNQ